MGLVEFYPLDTAKAIKIFLNSREAKGLSNSTVRWYEGILLAFARKNRKLPRRPEYIEAFLASCKASDERRHGYYRTLRAFYRFLNRRLNIKNPMEMVEAPRRRRKQKHTLQPYELNKLLSYPHPPDIRAAILFLIDTGVRVGELPNLKTGDLDETPWGYTAKVVGKTGARIVPIIYETYHALMVSLPFGLTPYRLRRRISKAFDKAGIPGSAITLRHTFATLWQGDELTLQPGPIAISARGLCQNNTTATRPSRWFYQHHRLCYNYPRTLSSLFPLPR